MATQWISPTWRMPDEQNQSKFDNYSLDFNGTDERIAFAYNAIFDQTEYSISFWIKNGSNSTSGDDGILCADSGTRGWVILQNDQTLKINPDIPGGGTQVNTASFFNTTDTWIHCVFTCDGTDLIVYKNGSSFNTDSGGTYTLNANTNDLTIGDDPFGAGREFLGEIGQVAIYDSALSASQITALYNSGTPVNPMALTSLPVAYYPLGGGSTGDAAVSSPATLTVPNESVPSATVFHFDDTPSNNLINLGVQSSIENSTSFTLNFWLNPSSFTSPYTLLGTKTGFSGDSAKGIAFDVRSTFLIIYLGDDFSNYARVNNPLPLNEWTLLSVVYDGSQSTNADKFKIYYGSTQQTVNTFGGTIPSTSPTTGRSLILGKQATGNCIETDVSNLTIFSSALQGSDITTLYNNGSPLKNIPSGTLTNDLTAWYKLNVDTSTWNGSNWIIGNSTANYTTALDFDGTSDYIDLGSNISQSFSELSISTWINVDSSASGAYDTIIRRGTWSSGAFELRNNASYAGLKFAIYPGTANVTTTGVTLNDGKWHHISVTYDGTNVKIYVDGSLNNSSTNGTGATGTNTQITTIAASEQGTSRYYEGKISNVSIYNSELSATQVETLYNNGTPETSISSSPISWWKLNNLTTGIQDSVGSNNGTNNGATEVNTLVSTLNGTSSGMTTANLVTSDLTRSIPYSSYSIDLDYASNDYIDCGVDSDFSFGTGDFTWSIWLNCESHNNYAGIFYTGAGSGDTYRLKFQANGSQDIYLDTSVTDALIADLGAPIAGTGWHHLCIVRTSGTIKTYLDTIEKGSVSRAEAMDNASAKFFIGYNTATYTFDGMFSNIAIWKSALSEDQILSIYNGGVPNNISSLSPLTWWSFSGDSYFNGTNFIFPDLGTGANNGTSTNMGGNELIGNGPGSTANGIATSMDIPANLKGNAPNSSKNAFSINMNPLDRVADVPA